MDQLSGSPVLTPPGLAFRCYRGERDQPEMLDVYLSAQRADQEEAHETLQDSANKFRHMTNCDPYQDVLIAEVNDQIVAYGLVGWRQLDATNERIYTMEWYIRPERRGQGLEESFLLQSQERLRQIIRQQEDEAPFSGSRVFQSFTRNFQTDTARLLEEDGFQAVRWGCNMTCSDLQNIPEAPLPQGFEVRPVSPADYRKVWDAEQDGFRDHWGYVRPSEEDYAGWQQGSQFQPHLWQVAWQGDQVVGMVLNFIDRDPAHPTEPGVAFTEDICVRPPWRRRGLARALLARSMRMFRGMGFTQTSLGVDRNNLHGARQLYESMGYRIVRVLTIYRKPVDL